MTQEEMLDFEKKIREISEKEERVQEAIAALRTVKEWCKEMHEFCYLCPLDPHGCNIDMSDQEYYL